MISSINMYFFFPFELNHISNSCVPETPFVSALYGCIAVEYYCALRILKDMQLH